MAGNCPIFDEHMPCGAWCSWYDSTFRCQMLHELNIAIREGEDQDRCLEGYGGPMMIPGYDDYQERVQRGLLAYTCMGLIQKIDSLQQEIDAAVSETAYFRDKLTEILEMPWESGVCPDDANIIEEVRKRIKTIKYKYDTEHEPIGPVELNGIKYVPTEYIKRLEAKYLQSQAARLFYATHNTGAQWGQVGELFREPYEKSARECLEHIKRGDA